MQKIIALAGIALCQLSTMAFAAPATSAHKTLIKKAAAQTMYECSKCHMKYTAAQAKKDHYKDPMDGGKLVPVKPSSSHGKSIGGTKM